MSFIAGFATGLAKSVDEQLKKSMERTQERIDGMAQYRVTRRRTALERQDKEKDELRDSIMKLASLVGNDTTKAIQMYKAAGNNITDANKFYDIALKSQRTLGDDFDINKAIQFASVSAPEGVNPSDFLNNFIDGSVKEIKPLPAKDSDVASGLYGALFKPKIGEQIMKQTDATAPLPEIKKIDTSFITPATVDFNQFLEAKDYQKKNQIKSKSDFEAQYLSFNIAAFYEKDLEKKKQLENKAKEFLAKHEEFEAKKSSANRDGADKKNRFFSKSSIETIFKNRYAQNIDSRFVGGTGLGESLKIAFNGNEVPVLLGSKTALQTLKKEFGKLNDEEFNNAYAAKVSEFNTRRLQYAEKVRLDKKRTKPLLKKVSYRTEEDEAAFNASFNAGKYNVGDVVQFKDDNDNPVVRIITASGFL